MSNSTDLAMTFINTFGLWMKTSSGARDVWQRLLANFDGLLDDWENGLLGEAMNQKQKRLCWQFSWGVRLAYCASEMRAFHQELAAANPNVPEREKMLLEKYILEQLSAFSDEIFYGACSKYVVGELVREPLSNTDD